MSQSSQVQLSIDAEKVGDRISPLLFGHNLEHTRSCMWRGMYAQLIRNRKFAGKPQQLNGTAMEWDPIGPPQTFRTLDAEDAYTRHYLLDQLQRTRRHNNIHSQLVQGCAPGVPCGIGQDGLMLQVGRLYDLRLVLKGSAGRTLSAMVKSNSGATLFNSEVPVSQEWRAEEFRFQAVDDDMDARLEITFEGPGEIRIGSVSLLDTDHFHGMRRDVVTLLKEIGCPILRWPGGNFAGDYRWQDGLLEPDMRPPINTWQEVETLPHTFGFDFHEVGIDEFMALCWEVGAEPFISINLAWDRPVECAAWLEYCNGDETTEWGKIRIGRGFADSYDTKYWSLGNELGYGHMEGPNNTEEYAEKARACAVALRRVDPGLELVMSGEWREEQWFTDGLLRLADIVDHIALHQYDKELSTYLGEEANRQFADLVAAPTRTEQRFRDVRAKVDAVTQPGRRIGISFDEWNVWYSWYRTPGVVEGIYAAGMLNALCRTATEMGVTIGCYFEPVNEGAIAIESHNARLTPVGQAFALFKTHHENHLLPTEGGSDQIDGQASVDAVGRIVITIVNRSPTEGAQVRVSVNGSKAAVEEATLLSSDDFLPASVFKSTPLEVESDSGALSLFQPKHSVVRLVLRME